MTNAVRVLHLYRYAGTWVFDDEEAGLKREPFVMGAPAIIDTALLEAGGDFNHQELRLLFSDQPFPRSIEAVWNGDDLEGGWYVIPEMDGAEGWLCPATLCYFDEFPNKIHFKVEVMT
jgi:hypothetical protein